MLSSFNPVGRAARASIGNKKIMIRWDFLPVSRISDQTVPAAAQDRVAFRRGSVGLSNPLPDIAGHVVNAEEALVEIIGSNGIGIIQGEGVGLTSSRTFSTPGIQRGIRARPTGSYFPFGLGGQALALPGTVSGSLVPSHSLDGVIHLARPNRGWLAAGLIQESLVLTVGHFVYVDPEFFQGDFLGSDVEVILLRATDLVNPGFYLLHPFTAG
jgi:hypothetical protein